MCNKKWYDIVTVIVSVLVGAAAVAYSVKFGFTAYIMPRLAVLFGTLALLLLTFALCSLLRQDRSYCAIAGTSCCLRPLPCWLLAP